MTDTAAMEARPLEAIYGATRTRVRELLRDGDASVAAPACPGWSAHDVVAHLAGLCADILSGNISGGGTDDWTQAQVDARKELPIGDVLAEWDDVGPKFAAVIDDFPGRYGNQIVADLAVHEQDIRGALNEPGARNSDAITTAMEFLRDGIVGPGAIALGLGPLEICTDVSSWIVGTGAPSTGDSDAAIAEAIATGAVVPEPDDLPTGSVAAGTFELFRALTGRRSAGQIKSLQWTVDPEPYLPLFELWPFTMRADDLLE